MAEGDSLLTDAVGVGAVSVAEGIPAWAVGRVQSLSGEVFIVRAGGGEVKAAEGTYIFEGDTVRTGEDGAAALVFADESAFSLSKNAEMSVDKLVYDPAAETGGMVLSVAKGMFGFVSGRLAKTDPDAVVIEAPSASISIRGSSMTGNAAPEGEGSVFVLVPGPDGTAGEIIVRNETGSMVMNEPYQTSAAPGMFVPPTEPVLLTAALVRHVFGGMADALAGARAAAYSVGGAAAEQAFMEALAADVPMAEALAAAIAASQRAAAETARRAEDDAAEEDFLDDVPGAPDEDGAGLGLGPDPFSGFAAYYLPQPSPAALPQNLFGGLREEAFYTPVLTPVEPDASAAPSFTVTEAGKIVTGTNGDDTIHAGGGDDDIDGGGGNDVINAGGGDDSIKGGKGNDDIDGGAGKDTIRGGGGDDTIDGGEGNNTIYGGEGDDEIGSGAGKDAIDGGGGNDIIDAGRGNDVIEGGGGNDTIDGGWGDDIIIAGAGADAITMGRGDDTLRFTDFADGGHTVRDFGKNGDDKIAFFDLTLTGNDGAQHGDFSRYEQVTGGGANARNLTGGAPGAGDPENSIYEFEDGDPWKMAGTADADNAVEKALDLIGVGGGKELTVHEDAQNIFILYDHNRNAGVFYFDNTNSDGDVDDGELILLVFLENVGNGALHKDNFAFGADPLVFDLDGDGVRLTAPDADGGARFDMDGDGEAEAAGWFTSGDALLVIDENQNGVIDGMSEVVSANLTWGGGKAAGAGRSLDALARFDDNEDGVIDEADAIYSVLQLWRDDGDGVTEDGELLSLKDFGITQIRLNGRNAEDHQAGGAVHREAEAETADGRKITVAEVSFETAPDPQPQDPDTPA